VSASSHFTAVVEVQEVRVTPPSPGRPGPYDRQDPTAGSREVVEVARVIVRADDLDTLREKVAAHVALIDS
jgi:hypothetical protein